MIFSDLDFNKFRGDKTILDPGLATLEAMTEIPIVGVTPYLKDLQLEDEDSLTEKFNQPMKTLYF